jgi:Putative peptidoglycan binding domain
MAAKRFGYELDVMKTIKIFSLITTALISLSQVTWAGPRGGGGGFGGGGHFGGGGRFGGGSRAAPAFSGGGAHFGSSRANSFRGPPRFYSSGARMAPIRQQAVTRPASRSISQSASRTASINRQQNRVGSIAAQNARVSNPRNSTAANRQSFIKNHAFARHDGNWHRDWDRRHAHFHQGRVFVFIDGFWWGLYPWDYYPYYADGYYPDDYYGYPYDDYDYYPYDYDDESAYVDSDQYGNNATVSTVQSELAKLGYYHGAIDGVVGDETEAALARYQEDHHLSVTGTLTAATLQSLGLPQTAS